MTRAEQQALDERYKDWREAYFDDVVRRVKHWGDKRKSGRSPRPTHGSLDAGLFEPGRGD